MESLNRPELIKEHNYILVKEALYKVRSATRQQLSALTGISTVTLGTLLRSMTDRNEAFEEKGAQPASGRPSSVYSFNAEKRLGLLVFVIREDGGYYLHAAIINLYGEELWEERRPASVMDEDETMEFFRSLMQNWGNIGAVGIGLPGVGFGEYLRKSAASEHLSLKAIDRLREITKIPFYIENDVNLAAFGYAQRESVKNETLVYLFLMSGAYGGSGIFINDGLHLGKGRFAGEFSQDWHAANELRESELSEKLMSLVLPYLTILAPHRLVIASDYITESAIHSVSEEADRLLGGHCPDFSLTESFTEDYRNGLKTLASERLINSVIYSTPFNERINYK